MVGESSISGRTSGDVNIVLKITQTVPYRVFTLNHSVRVVIDFCEVNFQGAKAQDLISTELVTGMPVFWLG